jgi:putative regulatory protein, FmdB family
MPTYEYLCSTCSHRFETWQKMTDEPLTQCPECGHHIHRVLFPAGIVFKGSGFYSTDYSHKSSTAPALSESAVSASHDTHKSNGSSASESSSSASTSSEGSAPSASTAKAAS